MIIHKDYLLDTESVIAHTLQLANKTRMAQGLFGSTALVVSDDAPVSVKRQALEAKALLGNRVLVCDGTADDVQIQAAIDAISGKGIVKLTEGNFALSAAVEIQNKCIHLVGAGQGTLTQTAGGATNLIIPTGGDYPAVSILADDSTEMKATYGTRVSDLKVVGSGEVAKTSQDAVYIGGTQSCNGITIDHITAYNMGAHGIYSIAGGGSGEIEVIHCKIGTTYNVGISLVSTDSLIAFNVVRDSVSSTGINIGGNSTRVIGNYIYGTNNDRGIYIAGRTDSLIIGNRIDGLSTGMQGNGIEADGTTSDIFRLVILGNNILDCGADSGKTAWQRACIFFNGNVDGVIIGNSICNSETYGVYLGIPSTAIITGNTFRGNTLGDVFDNSKGQSTVGLNLGYIGIGETRILQKMLYYNEASNPYFSADLTWTKGTGWSIAGGTASCDGSQTANSDLEQEINNIEDGLSYSLVFTVSNYSAGNVTPRVGGTAGTSRSANGTFTETIAAGSDIDLQFRADTDFVGDIDNVSLVRTTLYSVADGYAVTDCWVEVITTFDDTAPQTLDVGDGNDDDGFLANANVDLTTAGYYGDEADDGGAYLWDSVNTHRRHKVYTGADTIDAKLSIGNQDGTQGQAKIYMKVTRIGG